MVTADLLKPTGVEIGAPEAKREGGVGLLTI